MANSPRLGVNNAMCGAVQIQYVTCFRLCIFIRYVSHVFLIILYNMAAPTNTSFQKKTRSKVLQISGAKPSLYNNQLLISTGIPSLDNVIGGGMAVGTVLMIEEDTYGNYGRLLLKYFCAEAVMTGHSLLLASADVQPDQLLKELPAPILDDPGPDRGQGSERSPEESDHMKIAWRYRHLPKYQSSPSAVKFGHYYDLTQTMDEELSSTISTTCVSGTDLDIEVRDEAIMNPYYQNLLKKIRDKIETGGFSTTSQQEKRNILRVALHSIGSPLWGENGGFTDDDHSDPSLPRFLLALRALLRSAFAACVITVPTHLFCDIAHVQRVERLCDTVIHLDSFVGSVKEKNPAYREYHGLFNVRRLPRINSLVCHMPESLDLAFKLRRKKFTIEKLHLPPELSDTASRSQEDSLPNLTQTGAGCGGTKTSSKLDF